MSPISKIVIIIVVTLDLLGSINCFDHGYDFVSSPEDMRFIDEDMQSLEKIRVARQVTRQNGLQNGGKMGNTGNPMNSMSRGINRQPQQRQPFNTGAGWNTMGTNGGQMGSTGMTGGNTVNSRGTVGLGTNTGTQMGNRQMGTVNGGNVRTDQQPSGINRMVNRQTGGLQGGLQPNGQVGGMMQNNNNVRQITRSGNSGQNGMQTGRSPSNSNTQIYRFQPNRRTG